MRRIIGLTLLILAAAGVWAWLLQPGLTPTERLLVWRSHSAVFTPDGWRAGDAEARGAMLHDLIQRKRLVGATNDEVFALLGPPTCYTNYEDEPCYAVELSGEKRQFEFGVNHSDRPGAVVGLRLRRSGRL